VLQPLNGFGVSKVVLSNNPDFNEGDYVTSWTGWEDYSVIPGGKGLKAVDPVTVPLSYYLGCLGTPFKFPFHVVYISELCVHNNFPAIVYCTSFLQILANSPSFKDGSILCKEEK
jgi:hypothetical protein